MSIFRLRRRANPILWDDKYIETKYAKSESAYNLRSCDFDFGVTSGLFKGHQYLMYCSPGDHIESHIYTHGIWEPHLLSLIDLYVNGSRGLVLDIGANIGASTIPLATKNAQIEFHCYEPHPFVFGKLQDNISLNRLSNVAAFNAAISDARAKTIDFYSQTASKNMGLSSLKLNHDIGAHEKIVVSCINIDDIYADADTPVLVLKVDTQGSEAEVLRSAQRTIAKFRPVVFFELEDQYYSTVTERAEAKTFIAELFAREGYQLFCISKSVNIMPLIDITKPCHADIIAIPRSK
jgi:FkbM family methyltransferase